MRNELLSVIEDLNCVEDYLINNKDAIDHYMDCDIIAYSMDENQIKERVIQLLEHFDFDYDKSKINDYAQSFKDSWHYNCGIRLKNCGYYNEIGGNVFAQTSIGEHEEQIDIKHSSFIQAKRAYIESSTDWVILGDYAYLDLSDYCVLWYMDRDAVEHIFNEAHDI